MSTQTSMLPWGLGSSGAVYSLTAVIGGTFFARFALRLRGGSAFDRRAAHHLFGFSIVYLLMLFAALLIDRGGKASAIIAAWTSAIVHAVGA